MVGNTPQLDFFVVADENEILVWVTRQNGQPRFPDFVDVDEVWTKLFSSPWQCSHVRDLQLSPGALFTITVDGAKVFNPLGVQIFDGEFWFHRYVLQDPLQTATICMEEVTDVQKSNPASIVDTSITFKGNWANVCQITMEPTNKQKGLRHRCGHFVSGAALDTYVKYECNKPFEDILERRGQVFCPLKNIDCSSHAPYTLHQLAPFLSEETLDLYLKAQERVSFHRGLHSTETLEAQRVLETQLRSMFERPNGTFAAFQCPECGFGPIDHGHCDDLMAHQLEVMSGATKPVDNRCPECGYFAHTIDEWEAWDGKVHANLFLVKPKTSEDVETQPCHSCIVS